jgi:uncharacterized protein YjbI with pentapeptide repeats
LPSLLLPVVALVVWWVSWVLVESLPGERWQEVAGVAQALVGVLTLGPVLWAAFRYRRAAEDQRKGKHYQAWQAISDAQGKSGSGGRLTALQELHADGVSLVGVDVSGGAYLRGLALPGADLEHADFSGANLIEAHLEGTRLLGAHLQGALLIEAHLEGALLMHAHLEGADLTRAYLDGAQLAGAHLERAILSDARLDGAILAEALLDQADLMNANLEGAKHLTREQVLAAAHRVDATLPKHLKDLEEVHDCVDQENDLLDEDHEWSPPKEAG